MNFIARPVLVLTLALLCILSGVVRGSNIHQRTRANSHGRRDQKSAILRLLHAGLDSSSRSIDRAGRIDPDIPRFMDIVTADDAIAEHGDKSSNTKPKDDKKSAGAYCDDPTSDPNVPSTPAELVERAEATQKEIKRMLARVGNEVDTQFTALIRSIQDGTRRSGPDTLGSLPETNQRSVCSDVSQSLACAAESAEDMFNLKNVKDILSAMHTSLLEAVQGEYAAISAERGEEDEEDRGSSGRGSDEEDGSSGSSIGSGSASYTRGPGSAGK